MTGFGRRVGRRCGAVVVAAALLLGVTQLSGTTTEVAAAAPPRDPFVKVEPQTYDEVPSADVAAVEPTVSDMPDFRPSVAAMSSVAETVSVGGAVTAGKPADGVAADKVVSSWVPVGKDGVAVAATAAADKTKSGAKMPAAAVEVRVTPPEGSALSVSVRSEAETPVAVRVPDALLRDRFGGNYAARVRWMTPDGKQQVAATRVDGSTVLSLAAGPAGSGAVALAGASAADGSGTYAATPLSSSKTWAVSTQTGGFTYSYPFGTVPVAGLTPSVSLDYNSGSVDGRTGGTNNQVGLVGEGWDLSGLGYIERSYTSCAADGEPTSGDLCWFSDNATISMGGRAGRLVKDSSGLWHVEGDDGSKIEKLTGADNGAQGGEHWKVTTTDGTQYFFGLNKLPGWVSGKTVTDSTWTVPVFGNNSGEPCHGASFAASSCTQAWRWNLDYVVDVHGNSYWATYSKQLNYYVKGGSTPTQYVMGGYPKWIDYGTRAGSELSTQAPARLLLTSSYRCLTGPCDQAHPANWPDVPWDQYCGTSSCTGKFSPTFWVTYRLKEVHNQILSGGSYADVDKWVLTQTLPDPGDGTSPALWLQSIVKTSGTVTFPKVEFDGETYQNRVWEVDGLAPLDRYRITKITTETGGQIVPTYSAQECSPTHLPAAPESNTMRCFPQRWVPEDPPGQPEKLDYFHKYVVTAVTANPVVGYGAGEDPKLDTTTYTYLDSPAWRYDTNPMVAADKRTWSDFAGYGKVKISHGDPTSGAASKRETSILTYLRGMDGDRLNPSGGTKSVTVAASDSSTVTDSKWWAGQLREQQVFNGDGGAQVTTTINTPWASSPTATDGGVEARFTGTAQSKTITAITASPGTRTTQTKYTYDARGRVTATDDLGDTGTSADDRCARASYADNATKGMYAFPAEQSVTAGACTTTPTYPQDAISASRTFYDGTTTVGASPTRGLVTRTDAVVGYTGSTPSWQTQQTATYDALGRQLSVTDPRLTTARTSSTAYTPSGAGSVTQTVATNPLGWTTTTTVDPARGAPTALVDPNGKRTDLTYDSAGRLTSVWLSDRSKTSYPSSPSAKFSYTVSNSVASTITTTALVAGVANTSVEFFDGLARPRQTQSPDLSGTAAARVVTDTFYDEVGRVAATNGNWVATGAPSTTQIYPTATVPRSTNTVFDGAGRVTADVTVGNGTEMWRTSYTHSGDYTTTTPPAGATRTSQTVDVRGNITKISLFHSTTTASGPSDDTTYTYTKAGQLKSMTDASGNTWTWTYDVLGRQIAAHDPDAGDTAQSYDAAGRVVTTTDGRGQVIAQIYDSLDRKIETRANSATGTKLASWTWDTLVKGQVTSSSRFYGSDAFVTTVSGYDNGYRPTGTTMVIPAVMGSLAGSYTTSQTYLVGGLPDLRTYPAVAGLPTEKAQKGYGNYGGLPTGIGSNLGIYGSGAAYTQFGELAQITGMYSGAQVVNSFTRDARTGRVTTNLQERVTSTDATIANHTYTYNDAGDILTDTNVVPAAGNETRCYSYDYQQRLTQAFTGANAAACNSAPTTAGLAGPAKFWQTYTYDGAGNRTNLVEHATVVGNPDATRTWTYGTAGGSHPNALTNATKSGTPLISSDYSHDDAGNITGTTSGGVTTNWNYDELGKLSTLTKSGTTLQTRYYNADGDLVASLAPTGDSYLYLPDTVVHRNSAGLLDGRRTYANGIILAERFSAPGASTSTVTHPLVDAHGTPTAQVTANSTMAVERVYTDPFGRPLNSTTSYNQPNGFLNKPNDPTTSHTHLGARDYNPIHGRFTTVDPILTPYNPKQNNGYTYGANNPLRYSDPSGNCYQDYSTGNYVGKNCGFQGGWHWSEQYVRESDKKSVVQNYEYRNEGEYLYHFSPHDPGEFNWAEIGKGFASIAAGALAYAMCTGASLGLGVVACGAVGGAVGSATDSALNGDPTSTQVKNALIGAAAGGLFGAVGKGLGRLVKGVLGTPKGGASAGTAAANAAAKGDHIVLGIADEGLEATAAKVGGRTLMGDSAWRQTLLKAIDDPSTKFTVSLDGFSGSTINSQVMGAVTRGATPVGKLTEWEMTQLYQGGRLGDVTFMRGGSVVPNPWAP